MYNPKPYVIFLLAICFYTKSISQTTQWALAAGNASEQNVGDVATDLNNNVISVGNIVGANVDFDPSAGTTNLSSAGSRDVFVAKYTATGSLVFAFRIGSTGNDAAVSVATDASGNIYVSGWFRGTVDFDPSSTNTANLISNGESTGTDNDFGGDAFLVKYNNNGEYQWALNVGSTSIYDTGGKVFIDSNGDVLWSGSFTGTNVDFNPSSSTTNALSAAGVTESYLAKYTAAGSYVWAKRFGGATVVNCAVRDIVIDNANNIYVVGHFDGTIDLNPDPSTTNNFTSNGCGDFYVVKLNSSAQYVWGFNIGGSNCDYPWAMGIDASNNIYITGQLASSNADFNPGVATNTLSASGGTDMFVAKYDQNGNYVFANKIGSSGNETGYSIKVQATSFILAGQFAGTVDFDPGTGTNNLISAGGGDIFLAKYALDGQYLSSFGFGSANADYARCLASNQNDIIVVGGAFQGTNIDFDPSPGGQTLLSSNGNYDIFLAKYDWSTSLPVSIAFLTGNYENNKGILLNWSTSSEINVGHYEIQRSFNGTDFETIGKVISKGNSSNAKYDFVDKAYLKGNNFYRLRIVDKNGQTAFSGIVKVYINDFKLVKIYPNPVASGMLNISLSNELHNKPITVQVVNQLGQVVISKHFEGTNGNIAIPVKSLSNGNYTAVVINGKSIIATNKFIKE